MNRPAAKRRQTSVRARTPKVRRGQARRARPQGEAGAGGAAKRPSRRADRAVPVRLRFLGSGDFFSSGGRFHTCFHVTAGATQFLIDCGATTLTALRRWGVDPGSLDLILLTHLHGDHAGGLPFVFHDGHFVTRRTRPLVVAGPPGVRARVSEIMEALVPGSTRMRLRFPLEVVELALERPHRLNGVTVTPFPVRHQSGGPSTALRIECGGKVLGYSGDTEWTETLIRAARGTDLFVCECNGYDREIPGHLSWRVLARHRAALRTRRLVLTHMGPAMLARLAEVPCEHAEDGATIVL